MTRKEIAQKIKNEMPENLTIEEKAAYVMIEIAKIKAFDEQYFWGKKRDAKKIYKLAQKEKTQKDNNEESKRKLICVTMSKLYRYVASEVGLNSYIISEHGIEDNTDNIVLEKGEHTANYILDEQGNKILIDIQRDMLYLQTGQFPREFGARLSNKTGRQLSKEEIDAILTKIGYKKTGEKYFDEYLNEWHKQNMELNMSEKMERFLNNETIQDKIKDLKCIEKYIFYKRALISMNMKPGQPPSKNIFNKELFIFPCYVQKKQKRMYSFVIYYENNKEDQIYIYSQKKNNMDQISEEQLKTFMNNGLKLGILPKQFETKKLCKHMEMYNRGEVTNNEINIEEKEIDDILFLDER